jgi:hypothetical protein
VVVAGFVGRDTEVLVVVPAGLPGFLSVEVLTAGRETVFDSELLTEDGFAFTGLEVEIVDFDFDVDVVALEVVVLDVVVVLEVVDDVDLDGVEPLPPLRVCAKASD